MSQEQFLAQDNRQEGIRYLSAADLAAAYQLLPTETTVIIASDTTQTIKLPPVGKMRGKTVAITKVAGAGSNTQTIDDFGDDPKFDGATFSTDGVGHAFYSDGAYWHNFE